MHCNPTCSGDNMAGEQSHRRENLAMVPAAKILESLVLKAASTTRRPSHMSPACAVACCMLAGTSVHLHVSITSCASCIHNRLYIATAQHGMALQCTAQYSTPPHSTAQHSRTSRRSLKGLGCLRSMQTLPSIIPHGLVETPHGVDFNFF